MTEVFVLWHTHGDDADEPELVGVYSSRDRALEATARLCGLPGFRDAPEVWFDESDRAGFVVIGYQLDMDHWAYGHVSGDGILVQVPGGCATPRTRAPRSATFG